MDGIALQKTLTHQLQQIARTCLRLELEPGEHSRTEPESGFGGCPSWPVGESWPRCDGCGKPITAQGAAGRQSALGLGAKRNRRLDRIQFRHGCRCVRAAGVVAVHGNGNGCQDANDRNNDHQLDQGETLFDLFERVLHKFSPGVKEVRMRYLRS